MNVTDKMTNVKKCALPKGNNPGIMFGTLYKLTNDAFYGSEFKKLKYERKQSIGKRETHLQYDWKERMKKLPVGPYWESIDETRPYKWSADNIPTNRNWESISTGLNTLHDGRSTYIFYEIKEKVDIKFSEMKPGTMFLICLLISGYLQLGEEISWKNYLHYAKKEKIKFLPFVITPKEMIYNVYHPTKENIRNGVSKFDKVLKMIEPLICELPRLMELIHTIILLEKSLTKKMGPEFNITINNELINIRKEVQDKLDGHRKKYGFVYEGIKESQEVEIIRIN